MRAVISVPGYRIQHLLSWGAQGDVFLALDAAGREVALKLVSVERSDGDRTAMERLRREARLLRNIESPHVVAVRETVETEDVCCLVLEYLRGLRLDQVIRRSAGLPVEQVATAEAETIVVGIEEQRAAAAAPAAKASVSAALCTAQHVAFAVDLVAQLARGVAELHAVKLVHRDIKPENCMVVDGRVVLIDFGLARLDGLTTLTRSGAVVGSLAYMSPEQLRGEVATQRSDVYCLGATLHYCLVGEPPHTAGSVSLVKREQLTRHPSVRRANPRVSRDLDAVLRRALEPDPRDRYPDAAAMLEDLERCARGEAVAVPFSAGRLWRHHRRALGLAAAAAAVSLTAWLIWPDDSLVSRVARVVSTARTQSEAARDLWAQLPDSSLPGALQELNRRVGGDVAQAHSVAQALQLGLIRLAPRTGHLVALRSKPNEDPPPMPRLSEFVPLDQERCLLAEPGPAVLMLASSNRQNWWSADDPRCLQMLLELEVPTDTVAERSLEWLPTETLPPKIDWRRVSAGEFQLSDHVAKARTVSIAQPYLVAEFELSNDAMLFLLRFVNGVRGQHELIDPWIRHPAEPPEAAAAFWALFEAKDNADPGAEKMPALVSFWTAHRLAVLCGARLPSLAEWTVAARSGLDGGSRLVPLDTPLVAVDSTHEWDRSGVGVSLANTNAREWLGAYFPRWESPCAAVPIELRMKGRAYFSSIIMGNYTPSNHPDELFGVRVYRNVVSK